MALTGLDDKDRRILKLEAQLAHCENEVYQAKLEIARLKHDNRKLRAGKKKPR